MCLRSLLSLARNLRSDSGGEGGGRDVIRQALLNASQGGQDSDETDLLNLLGIAGGPGSAVAGDSLGSLSRLVENINSRRDGGASSRRSGGGGGGGDAGTNPTSQNKSKASTPEERSKLYSQMREAEREGYELDRRINAWNNLNRDCLAGPKIAQFSSRAFNYIPSTSSVCSPHLTYHILTLLHAVYTTSILQSEQTVTPELVRTLIAEEVGQSQKLKDLKRSVLITLASTSVSASKLVIAEIRQRLMTVRDVASAEILGKLIQLDFDYVDEYIALSIEVLSDVNVV